MSEQLPRDVLKKFRIIFGAVRQHFHAVEKACGVSGAQVWVMAALAEQPGMRVSQIADALSIHQSTASNLLDKVETAGLVRRSRSHKDQRVVELYLTEAGEVALAQAPMPFTGVLPHALEQLPSAVLERLNADLQAIIGQFEKADAHAAEKPLSEL